MAESSRQKRITGRVMHEFKHGELKSGRGGKAGKVKNRRQELYERARKQHVEGRSKMTKRQLENALGLS